MEQRSQSLQQHKLLHFELELRGVHLTCLMDLNDSVCLQNALEILRGPDCLPRNRPPPPPAFCNPALTVSPPLCHETDPLSAAQTVECGEADKVVVLVITEPTDMWETARWRGAVIEMGGYAGCTGPETISAPAHVKIKHLTESIFERVVAVSLLEPVLP